MSGLKERLKELSMRCVRTGHVVLSSGRVSDFYFNGKLVTLDGEGADLAGRLMYEKAKAAGATAVAGLSAGADPLVSTAGHIAFLDGNPLKMAYVRKAAKEHGTRSQVEGPPLSEEDRVAVLEDVVTTGSSALRAADVLRSRYGCSIVVIIALLDREEGGREQIERAGYRLEAVFNKSDFDLK